MGNLVDVVFCVQKTNPTPRPADSAVVTDAHARAQTFVLMIALIGGVVATLASPFIREVKPQLGGEGGGGGRVNSKADRAGVW
jgi:nitrous oxide reductase accessory protein NosL